MKNLKKVLSLALAFAMVLGLCIGASAAQDVTTLTDWNEVENKNAALMLNAFSIMQGHADGTFAPDDNVKRNEAAKMISVALWGGSDDVALYSGNNYGGYTDVVAGSWYMGYVNYLSVQKVMAGKGEGKFDPEGTVTGNELLKMCLIALGYNPETEGLVGAGWDVKTMALATDPNFKNLTADTTVKDWNAPLSRMNAATIIANMIQRTTVFYDLNTGVGGNVVSQVQKDKENKSFGVKYLKMTEETGTLVANEYGAIRPVAKSEAIDKDARGYKGETAIVDYPEVQNAKKEVVIEAHTEALAINSTFEQLGCKVKSYFKDGKLIYSGIVPATEVEPAFKNFALANADQNSAKANIEVYYLNGAKVEGIDAFGGFNQFGNAFDVNSDTEMKFLDTNGNGYIDTVVGYKFDSRWVITSVAKSEKFGTVYMQEDVAYNESKYGAIAATKNNVQNNAMAANDGDIGDELAKGDRVVYVQLPTSMANTTFDHGYALEQVTGKVTRISTDGKTIYVDGVKYSAIADLGVEYGTETTFFVYADGTIKEAKDQVSKDVTTYALVYDAGYDQIGTGTGVGSTTSVVVEVAAVLPDGTDKVFQVKSIYTGSTEKNMSDYTKKDELTGAGAPFASGGLLNGIANTFGVDGKETSANKLIRYELNADGTITLYDGTSNSNAAGTVSAADYEASKSSAVTTSAGAKYIVSDTVSYIQVSNEKPEKWVVYKGTALPKITVTAASADNDNQAIFKARYTEEAEKTAISYMMLGIDSYNAETFGASSDTSIYYLVNNPEIAKVENTVTTYEAIIYNGETNKVETVQYKVASGYEMGAMGGIYTKFSTTTGFKTDSKVTANDNNYGFIGNIDGSLIDVVTLSPSARTPYQATSDTNYYLINGDKTAEIEKADLAAQDTEGVAENKYQAIVITTGSDTPKKLSAVIVFDSIQTLNAKDFASTDEKKTAVAASSTDIDKLTATDTYKGANVLKLSTTVIPTAEDTYTLKFSGEATVLGDKNTGFTEADKDKYVVAIQFQKDTTNKPTVGGSEVDTFDNSDEDSTFILLLPVDDENLPTSAVCNGVTINLDFTGVTFKPAPAPAPAPSDR